MQEVIDNQSPISALLSAMSVSYAPFRRLSCGEDSGEVWIKAELNDIDFCKTDNSRLATGWRKP